MQIIERNNNISDKKLLNYLENNGILEKELIDLFFNVKEWNFDNIKEISLYSLKYFHMIFKIYNRYLQEDLENLDFYIGNKKIAKKKYNSIKEMLKENGINIDIEFLEYMKGKKQNTLEVFPFIDNKIKFLIEEEKIKPLSQFFNNLLKEFNNNLLNNRLNILDNKKKISKKRSTPFEYAITVSSIIDKNNIYVEHSKHDKKKLKEIQKILKNLDFIKILEIDQEANLDKVIKTLNLLKNLKISIKDVIFKFRKLGNYGNILGLASKEQNLLVVEDTTAIVHEMGHLIDFILQDKEDYKQIRNKIIEHFMKKIDTKKLPSDKIDYYLNNNEIIARLIEIYYYYKIEKNNILTENFDKLGLNKNLKILKKIEENNGFDFKELFNNIYFNYKEWNEKDWEILEEYGKLFFTDNKLELNTVTKLRQKAIFNKIFENNEIENYEIEYKVNNDTFDMNNIKNLITSVSEREKFYKKLRKVINEITYHVFKDNFLKGNIEKILNKYNEEIVLYNFYAYFVTLFDDTKKLNQYLKDDNSKKLLVEIINRYENSLNLFDNFDAFSDKKNNIVNFYRKQKNIYSPTIYFDINEFNNNIDMLYDKKEINDKTYKEIKNISESNYSTKEKYFTLKKYINEYINDVRLEMKINDALLKASYNIELLKIKNFPKLYNNYYGFVDPDGQEIFNKKDLIVNMLVFPPGLKVSFYMSYLKKIQEMLDLENQNSEKENINMNI